MSAHLRKTFHQQRGTTVVEFAFIAAIFFALLFGIIEFGRLFFNINSVQEVTRRAAREQVVNWVTTAVSDDMRCRAVLQADGCTTPSYFPGAIDITNAQVRLRFYSSYPNAEAGATEITTYGGSSTPANNLSNCQLNNSNCIRFVRAELLNSDNSPVEFNVLTAFMPSNIFPLPASTVIMPAESLGFQLTP